ncbi:hypothetical protein AAFF_G00301810 [Aldrovandia affinis]|uniref:Uncharacterized protein n=1 Tax=Aldrovandia affinis TaxID=143900 RepID=A0AAD7SPU8_9TELE|nr:hypothetical protein AAFF_G00301810 [Aldrovandia affinis]
MTVRFRHLPTGPTASTQKPEEHGVTARAFGTQAGFWERGSNSERLSRPETQTQVPPAPAGVGPHDSPRRGILDKWILDP